MARNSNALLFVYGTLREGFGARARLAPGSVRRIGIGTIRARLYDLGAFPGAVPSRSPADRVQGELLAIEDATLLRRLDAYEGFDPRRPARSLFDRRRVTVRLRGGRRVRAWCYFFRGSIAGRRRINSGNDRRIRRGPYGAYGSLTATTVQAP